MSNLGGNVVAQVSRAEHIGPNDTGDNIDAKKVANYVWDPNSSTWARETQPSGSGSGGTQYAEGSTTSPATGNALLGRYLSSPSSSLTNGQMSMPLMDSYGQIRVATSDGINAANVVRGDTGYNGIVSGDAVISYPFSTTTTGVQNLLVDTPTAGYSWMEVVLTSAGGGLSWASQFCSVSGGTYNTVSEWANSSGSNPLSNTLSTTVGVTNWAPIHGNFFQLRITAMTGGTTSGYVILHAGAFPGYPLLAVAQNGSWNTGSSYATGSAIPSAAFPMGGNGNGNLIAPNVDAPSGDSINGAHQSIDVVCFNAALTTGNNWARQRGATTFKSAQATASGNTALWTPTTGKKFNLLKFKVQVTGNATLASGAVLTIGLQDSTTDIGLSQDVYVPTSGLNTIQDFDSGWIDIGPLGKASSSVNNVLNINLSATLTAGNVRVIACGTEE